MTTMAIPQYDIEGTSPEAIAERSRLEALARTFQRAGRVLTGEDITVSINYDKNPGAPAWSDGLDITLAWVRIGDVRRLENLISATGLFYHELSHTLFTPRRRAKIAQEVQRAGLHSTYNLLEDHRIETFLSGWYPATTPFFVAIVARYIASDPRSFQDAWPLVCGRVYLPSDLRRAARNAYRDASIAQQIDDIVQEYRFLVMPSDWKRAFELIRQLDALLPSLPPDPFGHGGRPVLVQDSGSPVPADEQRNASEWAQDNEEEYGADEGDEDDDADSSGGPGADDGMDSSEDDTDDEDGAGGGSDTDADDEENDGVAADSSDSDETGDFSDSDGDGGDSMDSDGEGSGGGFSPGASHDDRPDLQEAARKALEDVMKDPKVQEEVKATQKQVVGGDGETTSIFGQLPFQEVPVDLDLALVQRRFLAEIRRVQTEADPGYLPFRETGRFSVTRYVNGERPEEVWDQWSGGVNDAADVEAVILADISGSMGGRMEGLSKALWVIGRSLHQIDASITVFGYESDSWSMYDSRSPWSPTTYRLFHARGGTWCQRVASEALKTFKNSRRARRVLFLLTDGHFHDDTDELIKEMNAMGVTTVFVMIGRPWAYNPAAVEETKMTEAQRHQCIIGKQVEEVSDLTQVAKAVVEEVMVR